MTSYLMAPDLCQPLITKWKNDLRINPLTNCFMNQLSSSFKKLNTYACVKLLVNPNFLEVASWE